MKITLNNQLCYLRWHHVNNLQWNPNKLENIGKEQPRSYTSCEVVNAETKEIVAHATAYLGKKEKHFNKETGRKVALRKLLESLNLIKEERRQIWVQYFLETNQSKLILSQFIDYSKP